MSKTDSKGLKISLWILQVLFATMFIFAGLAKGFSPIEELVEQMAWASDVPESIVRFSAFSEVIGGVGLLLPSLLRIKPILTPIAAIGLALIMAMAAVLHITRGEITEVVVNLVILLAMSFIAWGRLKKMPISAK